MVMSSRLYVGNLSHDSTAEMLRAAFSEFGDVTDVQVVVDRYSGRARGFAFVTMARQEQAVQAAAKLNGATIGGGPAGPGGAGAGRRPGRRARATAAAPAPAARAPPRWAARRAARRRRRGGTRR